MDFEDAKSYKPTLIFPSLIMFYSHKMKIIKWAKYIFFLLLGVGLTYLAFKNQDPKTLIAQLKDINYFWILASILFGFIAIVSRGLRWVILLKNLNFSIGKLNSIYAVAIGYFTNIAVPRAGEITVVPA